MKYHIHDLAPVSDAGSRTMARLNLYLLLLTNITGCETMPADEVAQQKLERPFKSISFKQDDARSIIYWIPNDSRSGLSCLPDWILSGCTATQRQLSPHEQDSPPTSALTQVHWNEERYSL